ncbi:MAG: hypothetical protein JXP34_15140 [Planctomycetes bacterium]|nr:hypothetical protein [Planctomycetota bacterium]
MRVTKVEAPTLAEALRRIRATLGDDAMIVGTRSVRRGGVLGLGGRESVEVYVADAGDRNGRLASALAARRRAQGQAAPPVATAVEAPASPAPRIEDIAAALAELRGEIRTLFLRGDDTFLHPALAEAYRFLCDKEVDPDLARSLVAGIDPSVLPDEPLDADLLRALLAGRVARLIEEAACAEEGDPPGSDPRPAGREDGAASALRRRLAAATDAASLADPSARGADPEALRRGSGPRVVALIGPTGVGKTTTIAKLAARDRIARSRRVGLVTLDTFRIAAVDQLRKYAEIMEIPIEVAADPAGLASAIERLAACDVIYVDSAGRSPRDEVRIGELESFLRAAPDPEVMLVLSTTARPRALRGAIHRFRRVGFHRLALTKVDEAEGLGGILEIARTAGRPISYVTNGQNVPDDIQAVDARALARIILGGES